MDYPPVDKVDSILTHERGTAQLIMPARPRPAKPKWPLHMARGLLVLVVLVGGWGIWSRISNDTALSRPAEAAATPSGARDNGQGLAALRPTFTPTPIVAGTPTAGGAQTAITADTELLQIVIVTPTPDVRRLLTVAGAVVDRPLAVSGSERTNAGTGLLPAAINNLLPLNSASAPALVEPNFDLATVVIPPMVEEVIDAPLTQIEVVPLPGLEPVETAPPQEILEPTPLPELVLEGPVRVWSSFAPAAPEQNDHFWVESAFLNTEYNAVAAPSYQFGSTAGGRYRPHHGLDIANSWGTPVRAGASGTVVHAGLDDPVLLGPYNNFYGNAVVVRLDRKLPVASGELDVYLLYGHLSQVTVQQGQHVEPQDVVGAVGMTGIAIGPHLHVEMRVGANTYENSVNAYLWLQPQPGHGTVAVRLLTADGRSWPGARLTIARFEDGRAVWGRLIETYLDNENIGPDPAWGENGAMGDIPAGYYVLVGNVNGEAMRAEFFVREGQTTFVELRTKQ